MENVIDLATKLPSQATAAIGKNPIGSVVVLVIVLILELGWCFFGYKAMKVFATISGLVLGLGIGLFISEMLKLSGTTGLLLPLIIGVVCAVAGFFLYKAGIFIMVFASGFYAASEILSNDARIQFDKNMISVICVIIGLVLAILTMIFFRTMLIISSAFAGGFGFASVLLNNIVHITWDSSYEAVARVVIGLALALFGMIHQFRTTRQRKG